MLCFGVFALLAILNRRNAQAHKRWMILAAVSLLGAAAARWPFEFMTMQLSAAGLTVMDLIGYLFLLPQLVWDFASRGRLHAVTLWGTAAFIGTHEIAALVSKTDEWLAFAGWAVALTSQLGK
jgi:hypothetical protein